MSQFKIAINNLLSKQLDEKTIDMRISEYNKSVLENKKTFIRDTTPEDFHFADIIKIDKRILTSNKRFIWIYGSWGAGKSYSLYAIRNNEILNKNNFNFNIKIEGEINYDISFKRIEAVDNVTVNESKIKYLSQFYFDLIDFCWKNHKRLYFSSTNHFDKWIMELDRVSPENAGAIASRFSNNIEIINLGNLDRRKNKI